MFYVKCYIDFTSYADDNTPYAAVDSIRDTIRKLESHLIKLFKWFSYNQMKANKDQYHPIVCNIVCKCHHRNIKNIKKLDAPVTNEDFEKQKII